MKRTSWSKIIPGQILDFNYRGKLPGSKLRKRRCLILNERHMYKRKRDGRLVRLVHALQLSATPTKTGERIMNIKEQSKLISSMGLIREIEEDITEIEEVLKFLNELDWKNSEIDNLAGMKWP